MLYVILAEDVEDSLELRRRHRADHRRRIERLQEQGRLVLAGPLPAIDSEDPGDAGYRGSLIVAEFETLDEARSWAQTDPFVAGGVYATLRVAPFKQVAP